MSLRALLAGVIDAPDIAITDVTLDSRDVRPGAAFLACKGATTHGLKFAQQAVTQGARAVLW
ncbi:MAG: Mur ligase domain-containing protein, partial [Steroidobacteraceae bacterium]